MAVIYTRIEHGQRYVFVKGELLAREVRHLEQACGPALEHRELRLTVDLDAASLPQVAREFLRRLCLRGALLTGRGREFVLGPDADGRR